MNWMAVAHILLGNIQNAEEGIWRTLSHAAFGCQLDRFSQRANFHQAGTPPLLVVGKQLQRSHQDGDTVAAGYALAAGCLVEICKNILRSVQQVGLSAVNDDGRILFEILHIDRSIEIILGDHWSGDAADLNFAGIFRTDML
jgi:hypothetical protein